jgi:3-dehydrosphinganine reductase
MAVQHYAYKGRLALITGGSSGIGLALARSLASQGARVWIVARRGEGLTKALKGLPSSDGQIHGMVEGNLAEWEHAQSAVRRVEQEAGVPDFLFNCAGVVEAGYVQEIPLHHYREMMDINYFGTVHMVKALLPAMLKRGSGHIVNFSSVGGYVAAPGYAAYSPSKYAVRAFSDVLRAEAKPRGIKVSVVFPPDTDTPQLAYEKSHKAPELVQLQEDGGLGPFKFGVHSAEYVAGAVLEGVRRGSYIILPGRVNYALYHAARFLGNLVYSILDDEWAAARRKHGKA